MAFKRTTIVTGKNYLGKSLADLSLKVPASASSTDNFVIFPGFCDVHVHLREPGFFYKESIKTGTNA